MSEFAKHYDVSVPWLLGEEAHEEGLHEARVRLAARELSKLKSDDLTRVMKLLESMRQDHDQSGGKKR